MATKKFVVFNLREIYHLRGDYSFKIVLDPRHFKNAHNTKISCRDSDGKEMKFTFEPWGRKVNCKFRVDDSVSDGVSVVDMVLSDDSGKSHKDRLTFWVIK